MACPVERGRSIGSPPDKGKLREIGGRKATDPELFRDSRVTEEDDACLAGPEAFSRRVIRPDLTRRRLKELEILHEDRDVGSRWAVVTVATDQTSYTRTQSVSIKATVRSGGAPVANAAVNFTVKKSNGAL